jgi:dolichyl-phosphate beta-glucosyltransferase
LTQHPFLSIIIPAYNEEDRLPQSLNKILQFIQQQAYTSEIILVENGSSDRTLAIARAFSEHFPALKVYHESQKGKGLAVKTGMLQAGGDYRFICDVDLSMPVEDINQFLPPAVSDADVTIASREAPGAQRFGEPEYRHLIGRVFNTLVRLIALPGLQDTQCGFKCFKGAVAEKLFPHLTITGWTFDVELLFMARRQGYSIKEIPIHWYYSPHSKVHVLRDSLRMALDLLRIRWNGIRKVYELQ